MIGPHRASRTRAIAGVVQEPHTFYIGVSNGGVWKTTDAGRTWLPIFDGAPTGSTGALAVAPSDPRVIYRRHRRSAAAARPVDRRRRCTSRPTRARRGRTCRSCATRSRSRSWWCDPTDAEPPVRRRARASLRPEHRARHLPIGQRRRARSRACSTRTRTPARVDVTLDPGESRRRLRGAVAGAPGAVGERRLPRPGQRALQVDRWRHDVAPADERPARLGDGPRGPHRHDRGAHAQLAPVRRRRSARRARASTGRMTPARPGCASTAIRAWWRGRRDAGRHPRAPDQSRHRVRADHRGLEVDSTAAARSRPSAARRAATTTRTLWINPTQSRHHGPVVGPGRGHLAQRRRDVEQLVQPADGRVLSRDDRQRVSRTACAAASRKAGRRACQPRRSRADHVPRMAPVGVEEYGYVAPDPLDPDIVYGGKVSRCDRRTGQVQQVGPRPLRTADYRVVRTDAGALLAGQSEEALLRLERAVADRRRRPASWDQISPDLSRERWDVAGQRRHLPRLARGRGRRGAA